MKRFVASAGLFAIGTSALCAAPMMGLGPDAPKPWSVSATLRGFYDDNINTTPTDKVAVFGFEVSPTIGLNFSLQQTSIRFGYTYSFKDYDHTPAGNTSRYDQTHLFNFALDHAFSERYQVGVRDSFVIGQEPDTLRAGNTPLSSFQRIPGENIRNFGSVTFNAQLTPLFGLELGYANSYFDYKDEGAVIDATGSVGVGAGAVPAINVVSPSLSGVLDRMEHVVHLDTRWTVAPTTTFIVGGQVREVQYTADELIQGATDAGDGTTVIVPYLTSSSRDFREYSGYVGAEHAFLPNLYASARVGVSYVEYYNNSRGSSDSFSPYAQGSLRWTYSQDNTLELGVSHDLNATDVVGAFNQRATLSSESTIIYANLSHHFTPFLIGTLVGQFQNSTFNGGDFDGKSDRFMLAGINLEYKFTPHFSAQAGYNYDRLESDIPNRSFDRNRVYIGVTAGY